MNKLGVQQPAQTPAQAKKAPAPTRDQIRAKLIGSTPKGKTQMITLWGIDLELRQPTLASILRARDQGDDATRAVAMIIEYAYVPGTDERVFEDSDHNMILKWPFGEDLTKLNEAIADLTGVDIAAAVKEMEKDPLEGSS